MLSIVENRGRARRSLAALARGAAAILLFLAGLLGVSQPTSAADGRFVNLSTRALVKTGEEVMIGGFIIEDGARQVLIQAKGPELVNDGISNVLADPVLTVIQTSEGEPPRTVLDPPIELMVNDNWEDSQGQLISDLWGGSPPLTAGSLSSAVVLTLGPGEYTAKVEGKNGTAGVALVEVYGIDSLRSPNLIFIMADDLGWADVGYNGASFYETPHIDSLCASGMKFNSAYPGASNCMPSRACIVSGMYTPRTQMWTPGGKAKGEAAYMKFLVPRREDDAGDGIFPSKTSMDPSVTSIAEVLKSAGYKTARFGKWHLGPDTQGFDLSDPNGLGGSEKNYYNDIEVEGNPYRWSGQLHSRECWAAIFRISQLLGRPHSHHSPPRGHRQIRKKAGRSAMGQTVESHLCGHDRSGGYRGGPHQGSRASPGTCR